MSVQRLVNFDGPRQVWHLPAQAEPPLTAEEKRLAKLSTEEIRQRAIDEERQSQSVINDRKSRAAAYAFQIKTPEYIACRENADAMVGYFQSRDIKYPTPLDMQEAYRDLSARGALKLNEGKILLDTALGQFDNTLSEDEMRAMPLDELRRRVAAEGSL
ncbi:MAG TPA: hypothetical protein VHV29_09975 [Terriglobales bacterium]|jgi:hypothetical protein|nr:hypothetical protein [Terriglobales bacterium]